MGIIGDFFVNIGVKGDTLTLRTMVDSMSNMKLETLGEITALGVLGNMMKNVGINAMGAASHFTTLTEEFGINTDMLQKWQNVARRSNVPVQSIAESFTRIQQILTGFRQGQYNEGFLKGASFLGIQNANLMSYDQLFEVLRSRVPQVMKTQGRSFVSNALSMMGIDPAMIQMFELNQRTFSSREGGGIISQSQIKAWTELNEQINVLKNRFFILGEEILSVAVPELLKWTNALLDSEGWIKHRFSESENVAGMPWVPTEGMSGDAFAHALESLLFPSRTGKLAAQSVNFHQNNKTDIHVTGGDALSIGREAASRLKDQQQQNTSTLQNLWSQWSY